MPRPLRTETIDDVELLATGQRVHGQGSPPEGDEWSREDLESIAAAGRDLVGHRHAPIKLGHHLTQGALKAFGDGAPAAGQIDQGSLRVEERGGVHKLIGRVTDVPKTIAELWKAKAYPARSVELAANVEGRSGARHPWALSGTALLGVTQPAVAGLADIAKLYSGTGLETPEAVTLVAGSDPAPDADRSSGEEDEGAGASATRQAEGEEDGAPALSSDGGDPTEADDPTDGDADNHTTEGSMDKELREALGVAEDASDEDVLAAVKTYAATATAVKEAAADAGIEDEDASIADVVEKVRADAAVADESDDTGADGSEGEAEGDAERKLSADSPEVVRLFSKLSDDLATSAERIRALEQEKQDRERDSLMERALSEGRMVPAQVDEFTKLYAENPAVMTKVIEALPVDEDRRRSYGQATNDADSTVAAVSDDAYAGFFGSVPGFADDVKGAA